MSKNRGFSAFSGRFFRPSSLPLHHRKVVFVRAAVPRNSAAEHVGLIRFQGKVNIVEASGAGGLEGISRTGSYRANREGFFFELDYRLP